MKKRLLVAVVTIIIFELTAVAGVFLYMLFSSQNTSFNISNADIKASEDIDKFKKSKLNVNNSHDIVADIQFSKNIVSITQTINFDKASKTLYAYVNSDNTAETSIKKVSSSTGDLSFSKKGSVLEISGSRVESSITVEYDITLGSGRSTLTHMNNRYYLTNFLITPGVYKKDVLIRPYKSTLGDPYIYNSMSYYIIIKADKSLDVFAPAQKEEHIFGANKITILEAANMRDFPIVIAESSSVSKISHEGIDIFYINSSETAGYVKKAIDFAQKNIGKYPYPSFFVVKAPITQNGMEFSGMIFLSDMCFGNKDYLKTLTYHEVLHQWFYGIIGTDQINEPFLDEGLVTYLSELPDGGHPSKPLFSGISSRKFLSRALSDYSSREEYYRLAYNDSALYFYNIHKKLGNNFYKLLNKIYEDKKFKMLYFEDFLSYASNY
ncbi:peptidase M1-like protein [Anaerobacterium chartisolvens]|uniref:Peptidase M1-like protein n=1 Tax=Anaerobacterium chartisolvens TaxID=1297424 RepID=A0A369B7G4_9FIRM|nr:hypothetical protein [Anaerobacterium chartisolvens]RCX17469.1 peptidase M1-like protein [Anaerobacterium chartisolvens]